MPLLGAFSSPRSVSVFQKIIIWMVYSYLSQSYLPIVGYRANPFLVEQRPAYQPRVSLQAACPNTLADYLHRAS